MRHIIHITYILCTYACTSNTSHMHNMCVCCMHMKYIIYTHICKIHTCNNVSAIENTCYVFNKHIPHVFKCVCVNITYVNNYSVGTYLAHIHTWLIIAFRKRPHTGLRAVTGLHP